MQTSELADDDERFTGVAPEATLHAYKVSTSVSNVLLIRALANKF
jgi:hypothetical protein